MKKKALISAVLTIALCFSVIAGSTFALFSAETGINVAISSAKVAVQATILEDSLKTTSLGVAQTAGKFANGGTAKFDANADLVLTNITPGDKATFTIEVKNNSNVDVQYRVKWAVNGDLYEALVATADGEKIANTTSPWAAWTTSDDKVKTIAVSVEMPVDIGNEFQDKSASVSFSIEAIQGNAIFEDVTSSEEMAVALSLGRAVKLANDITLTTPITIADDAVATIDLNGNSITTAKEKSDEDAIIVNKGVLNIVGDGSADSVITNTTVNGAAVLNNQGTMTIVDANIVGAPIGETGYPAYAIYSSGDLTIEEGTTVTSDRGPLNISGGNVIINGGTFTTTDAASGRTLTLHTVYASGSGTTLTINGGYFENNYTGVSGASVICPAGASINIYGGDFRDAVDSTANFHNTANFQNYMGDGVPVNVYGGTFDDATILKNVATGYKALLDSTTGIYTVAKEGKAVVNVSGLGTVVVPENVSADEVLVIPSEATDANAVLADKIDEILAAGEDAIFIATPGNYNLPDNLKGKTITISGTEDVKVGVMDDGSYEGCDYSLEGATVVFDGITITTDGSTYSGYARMSATYNNCVINNTFTLYGASVFNNCTFNVSGDSYNIWTWGAPTAEFNNCTFNTSGKAILLYGNNDTVLTVNNCVFNDDNAYANVNNKAAIEAGSDWGSDKKTIIANNVTVNGFDVTTKGTSTGTTLFGDKNDLFAKGRLTVTVDGNKFVASGLYTDGNGTYFVESAAGFSALNGIITRDAVTVELLADIDMTGYTWNATSLRTGFQTFNGNDHTISNMTINGTAMFPLMATRSTVTFKDVTFDNAKVDTTSKNAALITSQTYNNLILDNVDVKNSSFSGETKVAVLVGTVYNESASTITLTVKNCDISNCTVTGTSENGDEERLAGLVAWVADQFNNEAIVLENNTMDTVSIISNNDVEEHHAIIYISDVSASSRYGVYHNTDAGVTVTNCTYVRQ